MYCWAVVAMIREGKKPALEELWSFDQYWSVLLFLILGGLLISIGYMLLFIPGVILNVLFMYTVFFIVDQRMGFGQAMTASKDLVLGIGFFQHLVVWLVVSVIHSLGAAVGAGVLLTMPFTLVFMAVIYLERYGQKLDA